MNNCNGPEGQVAGNDSGLIVPESESFVLYRDGDCLSRRPHREPVREEIASFVVMMLGAPKVKVELNRQQLSLAVDQALKIYEQNAPRKDFDWYTFTTVPGQSRYKLECDIGIIREVVFGAGRCGPAGTYNAILGDNSVMPYVGGMFPGQSSSNRGGSVIPGMGSMTDWAIFKGYEELFTRMTGGEPSWDYAPDNALILYPNPQRALSVTVHYLQRQRNWQDVDYWIKRYALALAREMLGEIRSKFDRYVGPSGGTTLNGESLISRAKEEQATLEQQILDKFQITHMLPKVG